MVEDYPIDAILIIDDCIEAEALEYYLEKIGVTTLHVPTFTMAQEAIERWPQIKILIIMNNVSDRSIDGIKFICQAKSNYNHLLLIAGSWGTNHDKIFEMLSAGCQIEFNFAGSKSEENAEMNIETERLMMKAVGVPEEDENPPPLDNTALQKYIGGQLERTGIKDKSLRYAGIKTIELKDNQLELSFLWAADVNETATQAERNFNFSHLVLALDISDYKRALAKTRDGTFNQVIEIKDQNGLYHYRLLPPGNLGLLLSKVDNFFCLAD